MKKSIKIGLIVIPIMILGSASLTLFPFENELDENLVENIDASPLLPFGDNFSLQLDNELDKNLEHTNTLGSLSLPVVGFSDAPVTIIAFNDYQCKGCKTWYENEYPEVLKNLIKTKKANIVFLDSVSLGNDSVLISEATFCADEQERYSEYQEILFNSQQQIDDWAKSEQLKQFAVDLGLDLELFDECLDSRKYENKVISNIDYAKNFGVEKLPVFKIFNFEGREHFFKGGISSDLLETVVNSFQ